MAGAGSGSGGYEVTPVFANGHGEQCVVTTSKGAFKSTRVEFPLPAGVHVITIQEAGKSAALVSSDALRATFARGLPAFTMVPRPPYTKAGHEQEWCTSPYMKFKHTIAKAFRVVEAISGAEPDEYGDLSNFVESPFAGRSGTPSVILTFEEVVRRGNEPEFKRTNAFQRLCKLYDERIHIRYPGEMVADNKFTPISYMLDEDSMFTGMDGGCGIIPADLFGSLDPEYQTALTNRFDLDEMTTEKLIDLYSASIFPTRTQVADFLAKPSTQAEIKAVPNKTEPTQFGKTLVVLNRNEEFKQTLSNLIPMIVKKYKVTQTNPIVLYYPLCRVLETEPTTAAAKKTVAGLMEFGKAASQGIETGMDVDEEVGYGVGAGAGPKPAKKKPGGRRRRTYRKKKLRTQTRRRRQ